jgi:hypothetical protein
MLLIPASALKAPDAYGEKQCELIAKEYRAVYGGSLVWIQPLQANGAYELGAYKSHMINKVYDKTLGDYIYIDYKTQIQMNNLQTVKDWYALNMNVSSVQVWDLSISRPSFPMVWLY